MTAKKILLTIVIVIVLNIEINFSPWYAMNVFLIYI